MTDRKLPAPIRRFLAVGRVFSGLRGLGKLWTSLALVSTGTVLAIVQVWWLNLHIVPKVLIGSGIFLSIAWGISAIRRFVTKTPTLPVRMKVGYVGCSIVQDGAQREDASWIVCLHDAHIINAGSHPMVLDMVVWLVMANDGKGARKPYVKPLPEGQRKRFHLPEQTISLPVRVDAHSQISGDLRFWALPGTMERWGGVERIRRYVVEFHDSISDLTELVEFGPSFPTRTPSDSELGIT